MGKFRVHSATSIGKSGSALNEDLYAHSQDLYIVVDGETSPSKLRYSYKDSDDMTAAQFAAHVISDAVLSAPSTDIFEIISFTSRTLNALTLEQYPEILVNERPSAAIVVFDQANEVIWGVGHTQAAWQVGGDVLFHSQSHAIDGVLATTRRAYHKALTASGIPWNGHGDDPAETMLQHFRNIRPHLANTVGEFGYGCINGAPLPAELVWVHNVAESDRIVIASDGYPVMLHQIPGYTPDPTKPDRILTVDEADAQIKKLLTKDTFGTEQLLYSRSRRVGQNGLDDRTWVELLRVG